MLNVIEMTKEEAADEVDKQQKNGTVRIRQVSDVGETEYYDIPVHHAKMLIDTAERWSWILHPHYDDEKGTYNLRVSTEERVYNLSSIVYTPSAETNEPN